MVENFTKHVPKPIVLLITLLTIGMWGVTYLYDWTEEASIEKIVFWNKIENRNIISYSNVNSITDKAFYSKNKTVDGPAVLVILNTILI